MSHSCSEIMIKIIIFKKVKFRLLPLNFLSHNNNLNVKNGLESLESLKWCDRYWLIRSHWLISKSSRRVVSHLPPLCDISPCCYTVNPLQELFIC